MPQPRGSANPTQVDDADLVTLVRLGDREAFASLMARYKAPMCRAAFSILRNWQDAEDVAQEVCLRVLAKIGSFRGSSAFSTWLRRIVINTSLMHLRKRRAHPVCSLNELAEGDAYSVAFLADSRPDPEEQFARIEARWNLRRALSQLPPEVSVFVVEQLRDEFSLREVAAMHGVSEAAVKSRLHRARKALAQRLAKSTGGIPGRDRRGMESERIHRRSKTILR